MKYTPKDGWKIKRDSYSKMRIWFKDGNKRSFYSRDWTGKFAKTRNRNLGLNRLRKLVVQWANESNGAVLYDMETGEMIQKFYEGKEIKL